MNVLFISAFISVFTVSNLQNYGLFGPFWNDQRLIILLTVLFFLRIYKRFQCTEQCDEDTPILFFLKAS